MSAHTQPASLPAECQRQSLRRSGPGRFRSPAKILLVLLAASAAVLAAEAPASRPAHDRAHLAAAYGRLPLSFESVAPPAESGAASAAAAQRAASVRFVAHGQGYGLYLTGEGAVLALHPSEDAAALRAGRKARFGHSPRLLGAPALTNATGDRYADAPRGRSATAALVKLQLLGAKANVQPEGVEPLPGRASYFLGNDPAKWRTGVPSYARVRYAGVYPGVDLVYYGNQRQLEHDFIVAAGADASAIRLRLQGGTHLKLDASGNLRIIAGSGTLVMQRPVIYQIAQGGRRLVEGGFRLLADNSVGFSLGAYDRSRPLVIDPVLSYASYLGGSDQDFAVSVAVDAAGEAYLTGLTFSVDFPVTAGAYDTINDASSVNNASTAFVAKLNASGTALLYATYLGGNGSANGGDYGHSIAVDASGDAYVTGWTYSSNFPVTANAFQTANYAAANQQATGFVTELNPTGTALVYSTFLGGSKLDEPTSLALDASGNAYIAGYTYSNDFPRSSSPFQASNKSYGSGGWNAFIGKLNPSASGAASLVYSTYLGGSGETSTTAEGTSGPLEGTYAPMSIAVDSLGDAWVSGFAQSSDFPSAGNAVQRFNNAYGNAGMNLTLSELNPAGSALLYSTYLGGSSYPGDFGTGLAIDGAGNAYLTGYTYSSDFPTTPGALQTGKLAAAQTAFASKISTTTGLVYSTFLGGSGSQDAYALALDSSGDLFVTGTTASSNFPVTDQSTNKAAATGGNTAFLSELNPSGSALLYSTYLGGSAKDAGYGLALGNGVAYLAGYTSSADFPVTGDALQTVYRAAQNTAFAAAFALGSPAGAATVTTLQSSANPQVPGDAVTFTATVAPLSGTGTPAGSVVFSIDENVAATVALDGSGTASYPASSGLALGEHYVLASYQGSGSFASSGDGLTESIVNEPPVLTSISPSWATAGGAGFWMTVNGNYFTPTAKVYWNGIGLTTKYVSDTQLSALVCQPCVASAGLVPVTVNTSGGTSQPVIFTVTPGGISPLVLGFSPASATATGAAFTLEVYGANFTAASVVLWNGAARATSFVSSTELSATIAASDIAQPGTALVSVSHPAPNAFTAAAQPFPVASASPVAKIASASLAAASDASGNHLLTLTGSGFVSGSTVQWQAGTGAPVTLSAAYLSPWRLSAVVTSSEYSALAAQRATITVTNGAGSSPGFTLP